MERSDGPSALVLTRQNVPQQIRESATQANIHKGGYILHDANHFQGILIATGSEVSLAMEAQRLLQKNNLSPR